MRIGIDGSNLRQGGGVTHLVQLLAAADPASAGISQVTVWGSRRLLGELPARPWLRLAYEQTLDGAALARFRWQQGRLGHLAASQVDLLFVPGGTYLGRFRPMATIFRNMLPFDSAERAGYGLSRMRLKLELLRRAQGATMARATGVIFLTEHARTMVLQAGVAIRGSQAVIPHGLDPRFFAPPQGAAQHFPNPDRPFRWLYVSAIHSYKHPWNVAEAVTALDRLGYPVRLAIVGPPYPPAMARLRATLDRIDPVGRLVSVIPGCSHASLPAVYGGADGFVFASTCENLPNSLLEAMAAGLPIVCSNREPMPTILGDGGQYCDPTAPATIAAAMRQVMLDGALRTRLSRVARTRAQAYDWRSCARRTFAFLAGLAGRGVCQDWTSLPEERNA